MEGAVAGRDADYHGGLLGCRRGGDRHETCPYGGGVCGSAIRMQVGGRGALDSSRSLGMTACHKVKHSRGWVGGKGRHETCHYGGGVCGSAIRMQVGGRGALDSSRGLGMTRQGVSWRAGQARDLPLRGRGRMWSSASLGTAGGRSALAHGA